MKRAFVASLVMGGLMVLSAAGAKVFTPTVFIYKSLPALKLAEVVPTSFADWHEEQVGTGQMVNPETQQTIDKIYAQTLERVYVNQTGQRIMLSIAYGTDQRDSLQVHHPEICYPAQGFQVQSLVNATLATPSGPIAVRRLETSMAGQRFEPVTYWTTIGDRVIEGAVNKKLTELRYASSGLIPDGLLFRVSSIDTDSARAFALQQTFVAALVPVLPAGAKTRLTGLH